VLKDALFWINSLFDTPDTNLKQNIADLKSEIHELSKEVAGIDKDMAELNQQFREGKLSSSEYTESIVKLIEEKRRLD
jgi:uncharacterized coiled-coil DUF342 family protein